MPKTVREEYLWGIAEGREAMRKGADAQQELDNLTLTIKGFDAQSPVGQLLRGERDFWRNQIKKARK